MKRGMTKCMVLIAWLGAGTAAACSIFNEFNIEEDDEELCKDYKDNDSDGLKDCMDPECAEFAHCKEGPHLDDDYEGNDNFCYDGIDQGGDGIVDCQAELCLSVPECLEEGDECSDGIDNNSNGKVDCLEPTCQEDDYCIENTEEKCTDRLDNDHNGRVDCADEACRTWDVNHELCFEDKRSTCSDGIDNDGDGWNDCNDSGCGERGLCPEEDRDRWCVDPELNDEDGDGFANCLDPDCNRFVRNGCDPEGYSTKILEEEFDASFQERWLVYEYDPDSTATTLYENISEDKLHISVANFEPTTPFRVEFGAASRQRFFLWNNITDIKSSIMVRRPLDEFSPIVPAVMGLSVDATGFRPFLDHDQGGLERVIGRHSVLMLLADGFGSIQLCFRRIYDTRMTCYPESDPLPPETEIAEGEYVDYRLYIDDSVVVVYQNESFRLEIPNPFLPGVARLFFLGSTEEATDRGASELYVDYAHVYQAYPFVVEGEDVPPDVGLAYTSWMDPERELVTNNAENCYYAGPGEIAAKWFQNENEKCSLHFEENFAEKKVQVQYEFVVNYAEFGSQYAPGLWNPLMDYDSGLPLSAGMHFMDGDRFVFYPCRRTPMVPDDSEEMATPPPGTRINVVMGYDPDNNFSYAVLKDAASDRDFWSYGSYITTCYELMDFGISSMYCTVCGPARAEGLITNIAITSHTPEL